MLLPAIYAWFEPVLIASIVVFVIDLIGNSITFSNRYLSALVSAAIFAIAFGTIADANTRLAAKRVRHRLRCLRVHRRWDQLHRRGELGTRLGTLGVVHLQRTRRFGRRRPRARAAEGDARRGWS